MGYIDNFRYMPSVTKNLLIINVIVWIATAIAPSLGSIIEKYGALYYITSDQFLPTQLVSYMFVHASFLHLFFNMFALFMFGVTMERVLGAKKFLFYYMSCGIGAALVQEGVFALMINHYASAFDDGAAVCNILRKVTANTLELWNLGVDASQPSIMHLFQLYHTPTVGASGAIFGILLAFGFMFPNVQLYMVFPPIPIKARVFVLLYALLELILGIVDSQADTVAHFAHLGGMLAGLLILLYWRKTRVIGGPYF